MNNIKVSVCMITYNHEKYIEEAIQGVLQQRTNFPIEFVISNDASKDSTHEIITRLAVDTELISFKYYNHTENLGMMPNFIVALQACAGKYIALCEGDDYWTDPLKLQKQVDFMEKNENYVGCFHDTLVKLENNSSSELKPWRNYNKQIFNVMDTISTISLFHTASFLFRRESLRIPNWFAGIQSGDMALFALVANNGLLYRIDEAMSVYRKHEGGVTNTISLISYHKNRITLFKYLKGDCKPETHSKIKEVIEYHRKELSILQKSTFKNKLKKFLKI